jgi:hypothetical protein
MVWVALVRIANPGDKWAMAVLLGSGHGCGLGCVVDIGETRAMRVLDNVMGDCAALGAAPRLGLYENVCHNVLLIG